MNRPNYITSMPEVTTGKCSPEPIVIHRCDGNRNVIRPTQMKLSECWDEAAADRSRLADITPLVPWGEQSSCTWQESRGQMPSISYGPPQQADNRLLYRAVGMFQMQFKIARLNESNLCDTVRCQLTPWQSRQKMKEYLTTVLQMLLSASHPHLWVHSEWICDVILKPNNCSVVLKIHLVRSFLPLTWFFPFSVRILVTLPKGKPRAMTSVSEASLGSFLMWSTRDGGASSTLSFLLSLPLEAPSKI